VVTLANPATYADRLMRRPPPAGGVPQGSSPAAKPLL
jgi:hypothetical protein